MPHILEPLVGHKIRAIAIGEEFLRFTTESGTVTYSVYGDCCSHSYFHDFVGVQKLLEADYVVSVDYGGGGMDDSADDSPEDEHGFSYGDCIACYGYKIVSEHPRWGEVTSVFSFRNASNGYYGGMMVLCGEDSWLSRSETPDDVVTTITDDWAADA